MTRIAIVASSAKLRSSLAAALRASDEFEVVGVSASSAAVPPSADIILVARGAEPSPPRRQTTRGETSVGAALSNREREILELLFDKLGVATRAEAVATGVKRGLLLL